MDLKLVPIEGERILTPEQRERLKRRSRPIAPALLEDFTEAEQNEIRKFLSDLIVLIQQYHYDLAHEDQSDANEKRREKLNWARLGLFHNQTPALKRFSDLLELCPMEPWEEIKVFIEELRDAMLARYYKTKDATGIAAAMDNPFLMQQDEDLEVERMEREINCRITPSELDAMIAHFSLQDLVRYLIKARKIIFRDFWDSGYSGF